MSVSGATNLGNTGATAGVTVRRSTTTVTHADDLATDDDVDDSAALLVGTAPAHLSAAVPENSANSQTCSSSSSESPVVALVQGAVDQVGWGRYQLFNFTVCGLCWCADGALMLMMPLCLPQLHDSYRINAFGEAALLSLAGVGAALGAALFGIASDRFGRRWTLGACQAVGIVMAVIGFASRSLTSLLFCQLGLGAAVGGSIPVAFSLLTEWLPTAQRDECLVLMQVWFKTGVVMEVAMGWVLSQFGWRYVFLFAGMPAVLSLLPLVFLAEESAVFLVAVGRTQEASLALAAVARWNGKATPPQAAALRRGGDNSSESSKTTQATASRMLPPFDRVLVLTCALWLFANLASGLYQWLPELAKAAGASRAQNFGSLLVANIVGIVAFVATAYAFVPRFGYARLLTAACGACGASVAAMAAAFAFHSLGSLLCTYVIWTFFYDIAWPVIYASAPLLFAPDVRSSSFGIASAIGKLGVMLSPWTRVAVSKTGSRSKPLLLMAVTFMMFWFLTTFIASCLHPHMARIKVASKPSTTRYSNITMTADDAEEGDV